MQAFLLSTREFTHFKNNNEDSFNRMPYNELFNSYNMDIAFFLYYLHVSPFKASVRKKGAVANSVDPDQTTQNAASQQSLHCLH